MHQNDIFIYFLKIIFKISTSKQSKTYKKLIFNKKKLNFLKTRVIPRFQTLSFSTAFAIVLMGFFLKSNVLFHWTHEFFSNVFAFRLMGFFLNAFVIGLICFLEK
jgi:membrane-associated HD superfamily phosphohydrolase